MAKQWAASMGRLSAMMPSWLIVLDKSSGIIPVGIGETWRRILAKCLLRVTGQEAKAACGTEQLTGGVEAGVDGAIHAARLQWTQHSQEEEWGFSSLTRGMRSMRRTRQPCYGLYFMSGLVEHSLPLTATATGTRLRAGTLQTGQATSCTARRA